MEVGATTVIRSQPKALLMRACGLAMMLIAATPAGAHWSFDTELGMRYDNNPGNARAEDSVSDRALLASVAATQSEYFEDGASLSWGGNAAAENHASISGLNNLALGASISYRRKLGLGPLAPWWRASWSSSALRYHDRDRNGWLHQAELGAGKRISERYNLGFSVRVEQRTATHQEVLVPGFSGDAYSQFSKSVGANAEYAASRDMVLSLGGQLRRGDVVSSSERYRQVFLFSNAIAVDHALGPDVFAYRLTGNTLMLNVAMALFLSPDSRINIAVQRMLAHADGNNNYARNQLCLSWAGNF